MKKADFIDWKNHPVTEEVFRQLRGRISDVLEVLEESAGMDPLQDRMLVGAIKAYKDMINIDFDSVEEETQ